MKKLSYVASVALVVALALGAAAARQAREGHEPGEMQPVSGKAGAKTSLKASVPEPLYLSADDLRWMDAPPVLPKGARLAVLDGDPAAADRLFTIRLKLPADYKIMPHWHPADEHVTVVSGEFRIGEGDKMEVDSARKLEPGSYVVMPAKHHHFAATTGETIVQVHGVGPWKIIYLDPADDPRKQKEAR